MATGRSAPQSDLSGKVYHVRAILKTAHSHLLNLAISFAKYVASREVYQNREVWYVLRPSIDMALVIMSPSCAKVSAPFYNRWLPSSSCFLDTTSQRS